MKMRYGEISREGIIDSILEEAAERQSKSELRILDLEIKLSLLEKEVERLRGIAKNIRKNPEEEREEQMRTKGYIATRL